MVSRFMLQGIRGGGGEGEGAPNSDIDGEQVRFTISPACLLPIIQSLLGFEWPRLLRNDLEGRDKSRFCEYHRDFGHKTNSYFRLWLLLNYLVSKGHLQEYVESLAPKGSPSPPSTSQQPIIDTILEPLS